MLSSDSPEMKKLGKGRSINNSSILIYFASDDLDFLTGQVPFIDGGYSVRWNRKGGLLDHPVVSATIRVDHTNFYRWSTVPCKN